MYHFRTKKAMMLALVDHVAAGWLEEMATRLSSAPETTTLRERVGVYVDACVTREPDPADIVMLADPRLREELTIRWADRISSWFVGIADLDATERGYLTAARLLADGAWFAGATGVNIPAPDERAVIVAAANELLSKVEA
jgi:AcrR family transcriptional regulator